MGKLKLVMIAGESSGDLQGAYLAKELLSQCPDLEIIGIGSTCMRQAGVKLWYDCGGWAAIGVAESLKRVPSLLFVLANVKEILKIQPPDALILIDFGAFNLRVARFAKRLGIPTIYYFPPGSWARDISRAKKVAEVTDKIFTPFPWSAEILKKVGAEVEFFGHPLLDIVKPTMTKVETLEKFGLSKNGPVIGLLPGSRKQEIEHILPVLLETAIEISKNIAKAQFLIPVAPTVDSKTIQEALNQSEIPPSLKIVEGLTYDVMNIADLPILASGTATLEATILGKPMIIVYKASFFTWLQYKWFLKGRLIGMPNIILGWEAVPELLQYDANPKRIAQEALDLLSNPGRQAKTRCDLGEALNYLGKPGAVKKTAQSILNMCQFSAKLQGVSEFEKIPGL